MPTTTVISGTWLPSDPDTGSNRLLPFEVPEGTGRIDISYTVEPLDAAAGGKPQLDIGLFDPAGSAFLNAPGFRGWSGAFRTEFFLSPTEATPGYTPGPIRPGTWQILAGADAAMLTPGGLHYTIQVTLTEGQPEGQPAFQPYDPGVVATRHGWYRGNLHSHTYYSDGRNSIEEMADEHLRLGLQFGALTEHNILNPDLARGNRPGFIWLPSEEVTTYRGHLNVWGLSRWLDFRCDTEEQMQEVVAAARAMGAVTSINHPKDDGPPWQFDFYGVDCIEVWQAPWFTSNYQSLEVWERLLKLGLRIVAVGGSDLHRIGTLESPYSYRLDNPTTWVRASALSVAGILEGISRGHVFMSRDARGPQVYLSTKGGDMPAMTGDAVHVPSGEGLTVRAEVLGGSGLLLRLVTQEGVVHAAPVLSDDFRAEYIWSEAGNLALKGPAYIRAEVIRDVGPDVDLAAEPSALWMEAMTNPIYVRPAEMSPRAAMAESAVESWSTTAVGRD